MLQSATRHTWNSTENKPAAPQPIAPLVATDMPVRHIENILWESLQSDTGCPVATLTSQGQLIRCNAPMAVMLGCSHQRPTSGVSLADLFPPEVAHEQIALMQQALNTKEPVAVSGMLHGTMVQTVYRAVPAESDQTDSVLMVCSPVRTGEDVQQDMQTRRAAHDDAGVIATLTNREREILQYIGLGMTTAQIAEQLHRSVKTIEGHRVSLGIKLKVSNRVQLARIAIQTGLSPLPLCFVEQKPVSTSPIDSHIGRPREDSNADGSPKR